MFISLKVLLVTVFVIVSNFAVVYCACKQTYFTVCDDFEDLQSNENVEKWTELVIGGIDVDNAELIEIDLANINFLRFKNLKKLVIHRQIKSLKTHSNFRQCVYYSLKLEYLSFYGNEMRYLEKYNRFPVIPLKKLSLVNNQIQIIKSGTFASHIIEHFDLSNNLLETVEKEALPSTRTKIIKIRNNMLSYIEPGSFPSSLIILNLDNNKLETLEKGVLENLVHLEELTLSHNNFYILPDISDLVNLKILDISFNVIFGIGNQRFEQMKTLKLLNFNHNKISNSNILKQFQNLSKESIVLLAFNELKKLDYTDIKGFRHYSKVSLYGNPWDCFEWEFNKNELLPLLNCCNQKHFSIGKTPYCINYEGGENSASDIQSVRIFHQIVKQGAKQTGCSLDKIIYHKNFLGCFERYLQ